VSAAEKWPPGYRTLADIVREYGRDLVQTKLVSEEWSAFRIDLNTGDREPIPPTTWCVARGRGWLEGGDGWVEPRPGKIFGVTEYTVIVQVSERPHRQRKAPQADRIAQAIAKRYPNGTDGISTKAVYRKVIEELAPESKKQGGLAIPSETTVKRVLGRRK
jgi:hypothetical protein